MPGGFKVDLGEIPRVPCIHFFYKWQSIRLVLIHLKPPMWYYWTGYLKISGTFPLRMSSFTVLVLYCVHKGNEKRTLFNPIREIIFQMSSIYFRSSWSRLSSHSSFRDYQLKYRLDCKWLNFLCNRIISTGKFDSTEIC